MVTLTFCVNVEFHFALLLNKYTKDLEQTSNKSLGIFKIRVQIFMTYLNAARTWANTDRKKKK